MMPDDIRRCGLNSSQFLCGFTERGRSSTLTQAECGKRSAQSENKWGHGGNPTCGHYILWPSGFRTHACSRATIGNDHSTVVWQCREVVFVHVTVISPCAGLVSACAADGSIVRRLSSPWRLQCVAADSELTFMSALRNVTHYII